jgi:drug/metabolite transporter (DMT)-like permease
VALLRYLTASAALAVYALLTRMRLPRLRDIPGIALTGCVGIAVYNLALNAGEMVVPAGTASLIVASTPVFVLLATMVLGHERPTVRIWIGILISLSGVALIYARPAELRLSVEALLVLVAAIAQAAYTVCQKPYLRRYGPLQFTSYAVWAATCVLLTFSPGLVREFRDASLSSTLAVVYMGLFPGAIGYVGWSYVLSRVPASKAGSFLYLVPATAIVIAWVWLGEVPTAASLLGGALILAGVVWVNLRRSG